MSSPSSAQRPTPASNAALNIQHSSAAENNLPEPTTMLSEPKVTAPSSDGLWSQLGNAVAWTAKQDQIVWAVFGVFWAANAVLLVALFTTGDLPKRSVGLIVSIVGVVLSVVWCVIQYRAIEWLKVYETVVKELEEKHLHVPSSVTLTGQRERVGGMGVRTLMFCCPLVSVIVWGCAVFGFAACRHCGS